MSKTDHPLKNPTIIVEAESGGAWQNGPSITCTGPFATKEEASVFAAAYMDTYPIDGGYKEIYLINDETLVSPALHKSEFLERQQEDE